MAAAAAGLEFKPRRSRGQRMEESPEEEGSDEVGAPAEGADEDVAAIVRPMSTLSIYAAESELIVESDTEESVLIVESDAESVPCVEESDAEAGAPEEVAGGNVPLPPSMPLPMGGPGALLPLGGVDAKAVRKQQACEQRIEARRLRDLVQRLGSSNFDT